MREPAEEASDSFRADELRFRARRQRQGAKEASRLMLVILLLAGTVFVASVAVYFVNSRALTYEPEVRAPPARLSTQDLQNAPVVHDARRSEAATLYKCKGLGGATSYTNSPCAATEETVWARSVEPDRRPVPTRSTAPAVSVVQQPQVVYSVPDPPSRREIQSAQCANAKQYEADVRRRRGLKITFDELRQLSDMVYEACKGL